MASRPRTNVPQLTPQQCAEFRANPTRNPVTGAKIQIGKGTYLVLYVNVVNQVNQVNLDLQ